MTDLFLIAHRVRSEPAFDVALRMECPECNGHGDKNIADATFIACSECDELGYWWIIGTSGHRAYPYAFQPFHAMDIGPGFDIEMPPNLLDHYAHTSSPAQVRASIEDLLAKLPPAVPTTPFKRRF